MLKVTCKALLDITPNPSTDTVVFSAPVVAQEITVYVDRDWTGGSRGDRVLADVIDEVLESDVVTVKQVLYYDAECVDCGHRVGRLTESCACFGREAVA